MVYLYDSGSRVIWFLPLEKPKLARSILRDHALAFRTRSVKVAYCWRWLLPEASPNTLLFLRNRERKRRTPDGAAPSSAWLRKVYNTAGS